MFFVTTYAHDAPYVQPFLKSYLNYCNLPLITYVEGPAPPADNVRSLDEVEGYTRFMKAPTRSPESRQNPWLWDAKRFAHKAFAIIDNFNYPGRFFWIDADVVFTAPVPVDELSATLDGVALSYLGRDSYAETGFIGFDTTHKDFPAFAGRYASCYESDRIYSLEYWTDCHAFEYSRLMVAANDLTNGKGFNHVWDYSPLATFSRHNKGPQRKREAYGE